jgi:hypothetical protein
MSIKELVMARFVLLSLLMCVGFVLTQCSDNTTNMPPREVAVYQFESQQGNNRALGTLAEKGNFNSMMTDGEDNPLDEPPFTRYDWDANMAGSAVLDESDVFVPTTIYRAEST